MPNTKISFGPENWRGSVDSEINLRSLAKVAQAFSDFLIVHSHEKDVLKVGVGYDGRTKSKEFALLFSRVLSGNNIIVFLADKITASPALTCFIKENNLNAGVIITGGRFQEKYNGTKFISSNGSALPKVQLDEIESYINKDLVQADDEKIYQVDIRTKYYEQLERLIDFNSIRESGITLLIDSMGGAGQQILENLFIINDIKSKTIFKFSENKFSGRIPEPVEENLLPLIDEITRANDFSFGIATDGDADRIAIVTDKGEILDDNRTAILLIDYLFNKRSETGMVVKSFSVTGKIDELFGNNLTVVPVGLRFFSEYILKENFLLGIEGKGSFIWGMGTPYRDGFLTALIFAEMLAKSGFKNLSSYLNSKSELLNDIYCKEYTADNFNSETLNYICNNPPETIGNFKINDSNFFKEINGELNAVRFNLDGGKRCIVIRKSDYLKLLKIYVEGNNLLEVNEIMDEVKKLLNKIQS